VPLTLLGSYWLTIAGSTQHGNNSLQDLVAFREREPTIELSASSPRSRSSRAAQAQDGMGGQMIPYKSTNEMMLAIAAGQTLFGLPESSDPSSAGAGRKVAPSP